jgi:hypothetical protein
MKRSPADIAFSKCIRERADWICEYSGKDFKNNRGGLHCSHFYGRRARTVRWDADNAFAHGCYEHKYLGENPGEFHSWAIKTRGDGWYQILTEKWRNLKRKVTKLEEKEIAKHYQEQLKIMEQKRKDGVTGWLEFVNYE